MGLYQANKGVFDKLTVPTAIDKQTLIENLLMECAELEILYPDADFMRAAIGSWSAKELPKWEKFEATLHLEYNPIENYDRMEEWTDSGNASGTASGTGTGKQAGYNSESLVTTDGSESSSTSSSKSSSTHSGRMHGNIGVTTSQQMIEEERRISDFSVIDVIIDSFKERFCLLVY